MPERIVYAKQYRCTRCAYRWVGKGKKPQRCARRKCRSPYWDKPKKRPHGNNK